MVSVSSPKQYSPVCCGACVHYSHMYSILCIRPCFHDIGWLLSILLLLIKFNIIGLVICFQMCLLIKCVCTCV